MRWMLRIGGALAFLWAIYAVSPYVALHGLAKAIHDRDVAEIRERVNLRSVRLSLAKQIVADYLDAAGQGQADPATRRMVTEAGAAAADPLIARLLDAETFVDLVDDGWPQSVAPEGRAAGRPWKVVSVPDVWRLFLSAEGRGFRNVFVSVPADRPPEQQLRLRLRLQNWTWRLVGIELPAGLRRRLLRELPGGERLGLANEKGAAQPPLSAVGEWPLRSSGL